MKRILIFLNIIMMGAFLVTSCNLNEYPTFNDKNAFVAFDVASASVKEDGGSIRIPVTLASVSGISTTVTYEAVDGTAKAGTNFNLKDGSASLTFDATNRTQYIEIDIIDLDEIFTGDLKFSLKFSNTGSVNEGQANSCTITISDLDHPLAKVLGTYTMSATKYQAGPVTYTFTISKDDTDVTKVWLDNMFGNASWAGSDMLLYGVVNDAKTTITIPFGQESEYLYGGTTPVTFLGIDSNLTGYGSGEGNWVVKIGDDGSLDFGDYGIWANISGVGYISIMLPPMAAVKN